MCKNNLIYITGAPRCGKTTLANKMSQDLGASILSLDALSKALRSEFKDFELYSGKTVIRPDINNDKFLDFVCRYIELYFGDFPNSTLIVEGCHFTPNEFNERFEQAKIIAVGITTSREKAIEAVKTSQWMASMSKEKINLYAQLIYEYSVSLKKNAVEYEYIESDYLKE